MAFGTVRHIGGEALKRRSKAESPFAHLAPRKEALKGEAEGRTIRSICALQYLNADVQHVVVI
jgi:hypothetical protein